jgi:DNA-binding LacI/PurR family transcriptional regulator
MQTGEVLVVGSGRLVKMADVAASAGSTPRDVALVLAGDTRVRAELRQRIIDDIHASSYSPLAALQAEAGRPLRFALVFKTHHGDTPTGNRFYTPIASSIANSCVKHGAEILETTMVVDEQFELLEVPRALTDGSCDGAFLLGAQLTAKAVEQVRATGCPVVLVDGYSDGELLDSVVMDNVAGARAAVEHLIAAGHSNIALLGTEPVCYPSIQDRRTGYTEALAAHGLPTHYVDASYVLVEAVAVLGVDYIQLHPSVTAVFGVTDLVAVGFMQVARDEGFRLPHDISLVGFDDVDLASLVMPALTTMAVDRTWMGRAAFALLAHRLEVPKAAQLTALVVPRLIERESVVPPSHD